MLVRVNLDEICIYNLKIVWNSFYYYNSNLNKNRLFKWKDFI